MAGRGRGRGISRGIARGSGPRAGDREGRVRPAMLGAVGHRGLDKRKEERVVGDGYIDESMDRNELSPFLTELESSSSPPGEGLTAQDILKAQRMYEGDGNFGVGINAAPEPLRHVGLEMQRHAHRQVIAAVGHTVSTLHPPYEKVDDVDLLVSQHSFGCNVLNLTFFFRMPKTSTLALV